MRMTMHAKASSSPWMNSTPCSFTEPPHRPGAILPARPGSPAGNGSSRPKPAPNPDASSGVRSARTGRSLNGRRSADGSARIGATAGRASGPAEAPNGECRSPRQCRTANRARCGTGHHPNDFAFCPLGGGGPFLLGGIFSVTTASVAIRRKSWSTARAWPGRPGPPWSASPGRSRRRWPGRASLADPAVEAVVVDVVHPAALALVQVGSQIWAVPVLPPT
jgi:hypothetical protein